MMTANAKAERAAQVETAGMTMFAAAKENGPQGIRLAAYRVGDAPTFVILIEFQRGVDNPLPALDAVKGCQEGLRGGWLAAPPSMEHIAVIGDYRSI